MTSGARTSPTTTLRRATLVAAAALLVTLLPAAAGAYAAPASQKLASGGQTWIAEPNVRQNRDLDEVSRWGHDYLHARYYSNTLGRFVSVDRVGGKPESSQSWNRYAYTKGNPLKLFDPDGYEDVLIFKTERIPSRDPADPWGMVAQWTKGFLSNELRGRYDVLNFATYDVTRVAEVDLALSSHSEIAMVVFIGHATDERIAVGSGSLPGTNISSEGGPNDVSPAALNWSNMALDPGLPYQIMILGCNAGSGSNPVAQDLANASGATVAAADTYLNFDENTGEPFVRWIRSGGKFQLFNPADTEQWLELQRERLRQNAAGN